MRQILSFANLRHLRGALVLAACASVPFVGCRTADPRPGQAAGGNTGSGSGGAKDPHGSGGVDFGVGQGGAGGEGGAGSGGQASGSGSSGNDGSGGADATGSCGEPPVIGGSFSKRRLLESAGACSAYQACTFSSVAFELGRQVTRYADEPSEKNQAAARTAWIAAFEVWSQTTPSQYGPIAGVASDSYHGRGIGAFIHAWPSMNRCEVEKQLVSRNYETLGFAGVVPSARGLGALEYLLFYEGDDTACSANSSTGKTWLTLSAEERDQAKRDYAKSLVQDVYLKAEELVNVWAEDGENFGVTLANHEGYGSEQEALNVVAWSLLYPYDSVRDLKVGPLAGIGTALPNPTAPFAHVDTESIIANLAAFRALFEGCGRGGEGIGFDDWLIAAGADELAEDILAALDDIEAHAAVLPPLHEASTDEMAVFYDELKVLSDLLKGQFFGSGSVLNLKLPAGVASDTD